LIHVSSICLFLISISFLIQKENSSCEEFSNFLYLHHTHARISCCCRCFFFDVGNDRLCCQKCGGNTRRILKGTSCNLCRVKNSFCNHVYILFFVCVKSNARL